MYIHSDMNDKRHKTCLLAAINEVCCINTLSWTDKQDVVTHKRKRQGKEKRGTVHHPILHKESLVQAVSGGN